MAEFKISKNTFVIGGMRYFRRNASAVRLGSAGQKKTPLGGAPYLAVEETIHPEHLVGRVDHLGKKRIDWERTSKADFEGEGKLKFFGIHAKVASDTSFEQAKSAKLEMSEFAISEGALKAMLNQDAEGARKYLRKEGGDGRVVSRVLVLVEGELASRFEASKDVTVSVGAGNQAIEISTSVRGDKSATIQLEPGMVFGYILHKVTKWNGDKTQIADMEDDQDGSE